jgi:hypothetical protein
MFRKDAATIGEWSPQQVEKCWQLQRDIISDIWPCLNPGGLMIYSTCTFNTKENEENIRWILETQDAEVLPVKVREEWNITGSLLAGFDKPVYRFIPGISRSEGLFVCVMRKAGSLENIPTLGTKHSHAGNKTFPRWESGADSLPAVGRAELTYQQAIAYLRGEALTLPADTPRGIVDVTFMGHILGQAKNIGSRAAKEAVQIYAAYPNAKEERPVKELKGFAKTRMLAPGEQETLTVRLRPRDLAYWDPFLCRFRLDAGEYQLIVAASAADIRGKAKVTIATDYVFEE